MKTLFILIISLSLSTSVSASFWYKDLEYFAMENFKVSRGNEKIAISFDYIIKNPNWYNITLRPSVLRLNIAGSDCGDVMILDKLNIKRKTKATYAITLYGDSSKFIKSGFSSIWSMLSAGEVDFNLKGQLKAGVFGFTRKWKMDYTYKMTLEELMSFF